MKTDCPMAELDSPFGGYKPDNSWGAVAGTNGLWISLSSNNTCAIYDYVTGKTADFAGAEGEPLTRNILCCDAPVAATAAATSKPSSEVRFRKILSCGSSSASPLTNLPFAVTAYQDTNNSSNVTSDATSDVSANSCPNTSANLTANGFANKQSDDAAVGAGKSLLVALSPIPGGVSH